MALRGGFFSYLRRSLCEYERSGYWRLGLMTDDMRRQDDVVFKKAVALLPPEVKNARQLRISKAISYDRAGVLAPKEEWINLDTDVPYLAPYVEYVKQKLVEEQEGKARVASYRIQTPQR